MSEISTQEAVNLLQRLVQERRALEKGLAIVSVLADAEQKTEETRSALATLQTRLDEKQAELDHVVENISDIHRQREDGCVLRETQAAQKVAQAEARLARIKEDSAREIESQKAAREAAELEHLALMDKYHATEQELSNNIAKLQETLASLRSKIQAVAGV